MACLVDKQAVVLFLPRYIAAIQPSCSLTETREANRMSSRGGFHFFFPSPALLHSTLEQKRTMPPIPPIQGSLKRAVRPKLASHTHARTALASATAHPFSFLFTRQFCTSQPQLAQAS